VYFLVNTSRKHQNPVQERIWDENRQLINKGRRTSDYDRETGILDSGRSHDDELNGESNSISNQKKLLEQYAKEHGFTNLVHFTDDGISGTRFDRPGFLAMMKEVESGKVGTILIKDMSRMGRDYLKVGQYMELLRQKNVRLIAVNENVDSFRKDDDFTPFRNIMNEWYARGACKKIKSAFKSKGKSGKHMASTTPYGYLKDKDDPNVWIVDEEAAAVVRRIFHMIMDGYGPYQIARALKEDKVEIPAVYMAKKDAGLWKCRVEEIKDPHGWCSSTVAGILKKREYLGHTVNFKTGKHFKDKKSHYVSEDNWTMFENTQEAIIDQETFDNVQRIRSNVRLWFMSVTENEALRQRRKRKSILISLESIYLHISVRWK